MAMHLCRNIGRYSNKFYLPAKASFGERFSIGARSSSGLICQRHSVDVVSTPLSQIKGLPSAAISPFRRTVTLSAHVFLVWWAYNFHANYLREKYANWKAERKVQAMLKEMESKKNESAKAYLVALEREFNALKAKFSKRDDLEFEPSDGPTDVLKMEFLNRKADVLQLSITKRELGALKEMVLAWDEDEDEDEDEDD